MKKYLLLLVAAVALVCTSCQKDPINQPEDPTIILFSDGPLVNTSVAGRVIDESGEPVLDALVQMGSKTTLTDENGVFRIKDVKVPDNRAFVKVEKDGYFHGSRTYIPTENKESFVRITLLEATIIETISSNDGGTIKVEGGAEFDLPANGFIDASGNTYSGQVSVAATYIDPTASDLDRRMPGNLWGASSENEEVGLQSFGMIGVELIGANGQELQLADGQEAEVRMTVPAELVGNAPATIPLWHFDEGLGVWMEEGEAQLQGNEYVGTVSHFSFWNCDAPFPVVSISGMVAYKDVDNPLPDVSISITIVNVPMSAYGTTSEDGTFSGKIPLNEELILEIRDLCDEVVYSAAIGPFSSDVELDPIILTTGSFTITPNFVWGLLVDCDELPIQDGYIKVSAPGIQTPYIFFVDENGYMEGIVSGCASGDLEALGFDPLNLVQSEVVVEPVNIEVDFGTLEACDIDLAEFIDVTVDGVEYKFIQSIGYMANDSVGLNGYEFNDWIWVSFDANGTGTFSVEDFYMSQVPAGQGLLQMDASITQWGAAGEEVIGTFSGTYPGTSGQTHEVEGSFKAIRDY
jgi:hypothetical protein